MNKEQYSEVVKMRCDGLTQREKILTGARSKKDLIRTTTGLLKNKEVSSKIALETIAALKANNNLVDSVIGLTKFARALPDGSVGLGGPREVPALRNYASIIDRANQLNALNPQNQQFVNVLENMSIGSSDFRSEVSDLDSMLSSVYELSSSSSDTRSEASVALSDFMGVPTTDLPQEMPQEEAFSAVEALREAGVIDEEQEYSLLQQASEPFVERELGALEDFFGRNLNRLANDYSQGLITEDEYIEQRRNFNRLISEVEGFSPSRGTTFADPRAGASTARPRRTSAGAGSSTDPMTIQQLEQGIREGTINETIYEQTYSRD